MRKLIQIKLILTFLYTPFSNHFFNDYFIIKRNNFTINYLVRTRIIASLPCEIVLESAVFLQMGGLDAYYVFAFGEVGE